MKPISFEKDGFPQLLRTEAACRKAVERGDIKADDWILAYGEDGQRRRMRAAEHPVLTALFKPPEPPVARPPRDTAPPADVTNASALPPPVDATPAAATAAGERASRASGTARPAPAPTPSPNPAETPPRPIVERPTVGSGNRFGPVVALLIAAIAIFFVVRAVSLSDRKGDSVPAPEATIAVDQPIVTATPTPTPEVLEQRYAVREISVRAQPSASAAQRALLPRGTRFAGKIVPSANDPSFTWLEIRDGPHAGGYVSTLNLAIDSPAALDTSERGVRYVTQDIVPLERPEQNAPAKDSAAWQLPAGTQVELVGVIDRGVFFSGWGEIMLPRRTGVGYVPLDRLTTTAPAAPEQPIAAPPEAPVPPPPVRRPAVYTLSLTNDCRTRISLLVRHLGIDGWQTTLVNMPRGSTAVLGPDNTPGSLLSDQVQFAFYSVDGVVKRETGPTRVMFRGEPFYLRPMKVSRRASNVLGAAFTCSG